MNPDETIVTLELELERPVTPGDLERAYCALLEEVDR